jgi:large subunit ribosomal protein L7/L12
MNEQINKIILNLKTLTLLETAQLVTEVKKVFDINLENNVQLNNKDNTSENIISKSLENEQDSYSITLMEVPVDKKIAILKFIRNLTGLGLKESKDIIDNTPKLIKENLKKEELNKIKTEFELLGAKIKVI